MAKKTQNLQKMTVAALDSIPPQKRIETLEELCPLPPNKNSKALNSSNNIVVQTLREVKAS